MKFADFHAGQHLVAGPVTLTEEEIVAFARAWDPQWFHTDPKSGEALQRLFRRHRRAVLHPVRRPARVEPDDHIAALDLPDDDGAGTDTIVLATAPESAPEARHGAGRQVDRQP